MSEIERGVQHSISTTRRSVEAYVFERDDSACRVVALELRKLIMDTNAAASFAPRSRKKKRKRSLFELQYGSQDNISDEALDAYRNRYGQWVTKDQIFAYVYGILHSPEYREQYASDLAGMLPRIPEVATAKAFDSFSKAGQQLLELHIGYEAAEPYPLEERLKSGAPDGPERYRVQKMRWGGPTRTPDHSVIVYNDWITLAGIPDEAHEYVVGPRSALEWLLERYRVTTDKASGIVNDAND